MWAESRLPRLPQNVVTGKIRFDDSYIFGAAISYVPIKRFDIPLLFGLSLPDNSLELEGQLVKHFGKQDHLEGTAAVVIRSGEIHPFEKLSFNVAWANGLSFAFSDPAHELGTTGKRGVDTRRMQYYMGIETEFTHSALPDFHLVTKLHHRSGIYGVISPSKTGSNFIGAGLRWDFGK